MKPVKLDQLLSDLLHGLSTADRGVFISSAEGDCEGLPSLVLMPLRHDCPKCGAKKWHTCLEPISPDSDTPFFHGERWSVAREASLAEAEKCEAESAYLLEQGGRPVVLETDAQFWPLAYESPCMECGAERGEGCFHLNPDAPGSDELPWGVVHGERHSLARSDEE